MKKILILDRDGTLIIEPPETEQVNSLEELSLVPGVISSLKRFTEAGYELVIVTNQDGLGTAANPRETYNLVNRKLFEIFESEGIRFIDVFECPHYPNDDCVCRKPKTGLLGNFLREQSVDYAHSYVIGDRDTDLELAKNIGLKGFRLGLQMWSEIAAAILDEPRSAEVVRKTKETDITVRFNLDGSGKYHIDTGLKFFDHMLMQLARHGGFDLDLTCRGDLEIDEHHTIEDTALALGDAFKKALGDKRGIIRYAWERVLPMDEARAEVALDISGRPYLLFDANFSREYVGDFPTEMLAHFFRSFCEQAGINLHLTIGGENTHHMVEAAFKAFSRCLRDAVRQEGSAVPSTKGVL